MGGNAYGHAAYACLRSTPCEWSVLGTVDLETKETDVSADEISLLHITVIYNLQKHRSYNSIYNSHEQTTTVPEYRGVWRSWRAVRRSCHAYLSDHDWLHWRWGFCIPTPRRFVGMSMKRWARMWIHIGCIGQIIQQHIHICRNHEKQRQETSTSKWRLHEDTYTSTRPYTQVIIPVLDCWMRRASMQWSSLYPQHSEWRCSQLASRHKEDDLCMKPCVGIWTSMNVCVCVCSHASMFVIVSCQAWQENLHVFTYPQIYAHACSCTHQINNTRRLHVCNYACMHYHMRADVMLFDMALTSAFSSINTLQISAYV